MIRVEAREPTVNISPIAAPFCPIPMTASSIARAQHESSVETLFRPTLAPPEPHFMYGLIKIQNEIENQIKLEGAICDQETKRDLARLQEIDKKKLEILRQHAEDLKAKASWGVWQTVAQYIASSSAIMLGMTLLGPAPLAGGLLIAAGGLGLINRAMADTGGWQYLVSQFTQSHEDQVRIAQNLDSYVLYLSIALSLAGAVSAYYAGALALLPETPRGAIMNKALQIVLFASSALQAITRLGLAHTDKKLLYAEAGQKEAESSSACVRQEIQTNIAHMRKIIDCSETLSAMLKQTIESMA